MKWWWCFDCKFHPKSELWRPVAPFFWGGWGLRLLGKVQYIKIPNISCPDANQFIYEVMMRFWLHIKNLGSFWVLNGVIEDRLRWHNVSSHPRMSSFNIYNHFWPFLGGAIKTTNFNAVSWVFLHLLRVDFEEDVAALESNSHRDGIVRKFTWKDMLEKVDWWVGGWHNWFIVTPGPFSL